MKSEEPPFRGSEPDRANGFGDPERFVVIRSEDLKICCEAVVRCGLNMATPCTVCAPLPAASCI